jgi:hypothetical protein
MLSALTRTRRRVIALFAILFMLLAGGLVAQQVNATPAHAAGQLWNVSSGGHYTIEVQTKWGNVVTLRPGWSALNIDYVIVRQGQCIYISYKGTYCPARGSVWVYTGNYASLNANRTR